VDGCQTTVNIVFSEGTLSKWQSIANMIAEIINIPAALIMRLSESDIEVFISSNTQGNPYNPGDREKLIGSGLYCEEVINSNDKLLVPNAIEDPKWKNNPDIKFNMISYLGYPIRYPNGIPFGTICVLDNKQNNYKESFEKLIQHFRDMLEYQLELIYSNSMLGEKYKDLSGFVSEVKTLRGIIPICAECKKIRNDEGYWTQVEEYVEDHSNAKFSHGLCGECADDLYGGEDWYIKSKT